MRAIKGLRGVLFSSLGLLAGDPFIVTAGTKVTIDVDTPSLGYTDIAGTVILPNGRTLTTAGLGISLGGTFSAGTAGTPITYNIVLTGAYVPLTNVTINGFTTPTNPGVSRAIMCAGGTLELHGTAPATLYTFLNQSSPVAAATTALTTAVSLGAASGDAIIIANTEFPLVASFPTANRFRETEIFTLATPTSGTSLTLPSGLAWDKWAALQYPVDVAVSGSNMALTQNTFSAGKASATVPIVLDERARVANLMRGGTISCPNDSDWINKGHGVAIMWMNSGTSQPVVHIEGTQVRRGGQRGALGGYPFHAHMNSGVSGTSTVLPDVTGNYVRKCTVYDSENRAYVCHGTNGMEWSDNIAFNVKGHAYMMGEDGGEQRNKLYRNMAFKTRQPNQATALPAGFVSMSGNGTTTTVNWTGHGLYSGSTITCTGASIGGFNVFRCPVTVISANQFTYPSTGNGTPTGMTITYGNDQIKVHDLGSSGFWITNLNNDIQDNYSSDSFSGDLNADPLTGNGFWVSLASGAVGRSAALVVNPSTLDILTFKGCIGHSNYGRGLNFAGPVIDEAGNVGTVPKYVPPLGIGSTDHIFFKNTTGAYQNLVGVTRYDRWTSADNGEIDFVGSTNNGGTSDNHLLIGTSLNNVVPQPPTAVYPRAAFIPYHGTINFRNCTFVNFPYAAFVFNGPQDKGFGGGANSGGTDTYDTPGLDLTNGYNTGHKYLNSHPGPVAHPIDLDGRTVDDAVQPRHWSIAGAYQDLDGKYGTAGRFVIPFSRSAGGALLAVDDRYLTGAASVADGPVTGTAVCKTTTTRYFGAGNADAVNFQSNTSVAFNTLAGSQTPITITRQVPATGVTIGTPQVIKDGSTAGNGFSGYRAFALQNGARYLLQYTDGTVTVGPPTTYCYFELANANNSGDFVVIGLPWSGAVVPRICMGSHFSNESGTFASTTAVTGDVATGKAIVPTTSGTLAQVIADTTGNTYFRDTVNDTVWVRYTALPFVANPNTGSGLPFDYDVQKINIKV